MNSWSTKSQGFHLNNLNDPKLLAEGVFSSSKWFKRDRPYTPWNVRFFQVRPWISQRLEDGPHFLLGVGQFSEANVILGGVHIIENIARNQINTFNTVVSDRWDWNKNCSCQSPPTAEALERPNWEDVKWWLLQSWQVPCCLFVGWIYGTWKEVLPPPTIKRLLP